MKHLNDSQFLKTDSDTYFIRKYMSMLLLTNVNNVSFSILCISFNNKTLQFNNTITNSSLAPRITIIPNNTNYTFTVTYFRHYYFIS